jgi:hypothetical protein
MRSDVVTPEPGSVFRAPTFADKPQGPLIIFRLVASTTPVSIEYTHSLADTVFAVRMWHGLPPGSPRPYIVFCADGLDEAATTVDVVAECVPPGVVTVKKAAVGHPRWTPPAWLMAAPIRWHTAEIV